MPIPEFNQSDDLPPGVHPATLSEIIARFGGTSPQRQQVTRRLRRIYDLVKATGKLKRFLIFGSYVTAKPAPNDLDVFMIMAVDFAVGSDAGSAETLFRHAQAEQGFGASVFWAYDDTDKGILDDLIEGWQMKRDGAYRGIVEVIE